MARSNPLIERLECRLAWHQTLHDHRCEPRNGLRWLPELRRWQAARLETSFEHFLNDPRRRDAALFFLTDVYGDHDFSRRDANVAKVVPMMQRMLPAAVLETVADGIELGVLTHALDLRMAQALQGLAPNRKRLDADLYARAYREVNYPRLRGHQIDLIAHLGVGLTKAVRMPGVSTLLRLSRGPAKATGLGELQGFLERGFAAFSALGDGRAFVEDIERSEREISRRLFAGEADPFAE
ncbi:FFLEELY motif protein [Pseudoxanthomonas wuyuanensis]